jgi:signal peptidase
MNQFRLNVLFFIFLIIIIFGYIFSPIGLASIAGISMFPTLDNGSIVIFLKGAYAEVGSIIIYRSFSGSYIVHRIITVNQGYIITKGDNNPFPDYSEFNNKYGISISRIVGEVISINNFVFQIPYLGYLSLLFSP